jgi:hypothetical protein
MQFPIVVAGPLIFSNGSVKNTNGICPIIARNPTPINFAYQRHLNAGKVQHELESQVTVHA